MRFPVRSGGAGARAGKFGGSSAEFLEHREYSPGDDARRIDWAAYARSQNTVIKRFRAEEDAWVRLVVDASGSMAFGEPTKFTHAQRIAAALGYLALAQGERVDTCFAPAGQRPDGTAGMSTSDPVRGASARGRLLRGLANHGPRGPGRLAESALKLMAHAKVKTAIVVLSDFLEDGVEDALARLAARGHTLFLVQVLSREELQPDLFGDFLLEDAETGDQLPFTADEQSIAQYTHALGALQTRLRELAIASRGRFVSTSSDEALSDLLPRFVAA